MVKVFREFCVRELPDDQADICIFVVVLLADLPTFVLEARGEGSTVTEVELRVDGVVVNILDFIVSDFVGVDIVVIAGVDHRFHLILQQFSQMRVQIDQSLVLCTLEGHLVEFFVVVVGPDVLHQLLDLRCIDGHTRSVELSEVVLVEEHIDLVNDQDPVDSALALEQFVESFEVLQLHLAELLVEQHLFGHLLEVMLIGFVENRLAVLRKGPIADHVVHAEPYEQRFELFLVSLRQIGRIAPAVDVEPQQRQVTVQSSQYSRFAFSGLDLDEPVAQPSVLVMVSVNEEKDGNYLRNVRVSVEGGFLLVRVDAAIDGVNCENPCDDDGGGEFSSLRLSLLDELDDVVLGFALDVLSLDSLQLVPVGLVGTDEFPGELLVIPDLRRFLDDFVDVVHSHGVLPELLLVNLFEDVHRGSTHLEVTTVGLLDIVDEYILDVLVVLVDVVLYLCQNLLAELLDLDIEVGLHLLHHQEVFEDLVDDVLGTRVELLAEELGLCDLLVEDALLLGPSLVDQGVELCLDLLLPEGFVLDLMEGVLDVLNEFVVLELDGFLGGVDVDLLLLLHLLHVERKRLVLLLQVLDIALHLLLDFEQLMDDYLLEVVLLLDDLVEGHHVFVLDDFLLVEDHLVLEDDIHLLVVEHLGDFLLYYRVLLDPGHLDDADDLLVVDVLEPQVLEVVVLEVALVLVELELHVLEDLHHPLHLLEVLVEELVVIVLQFQLVLVELELLHLLEYLLDLRVDALYDLLVAALHRVVLVAWADVLELLHQLAVDLDLHQLQEQLLPVALLLEDVLVVQALAQTLEVVDHISLDPVDLVVELLPLLLVEQTLILILAEHRVQFVGVDQRLSDLVDDSLVIALKLLDELDVAPDQLQLRAAEVDLVLLALEDLAGSLGVVEVEFVEFVKEGALLVVVIGDVVVGVGGVLIEDVDVQFVELGLGLLVLLALADEGGQVLEVVLLELALLAVDEPLPLVDDLALVDVGELAVVGDLLVLQLIEPLHQLALGHAVHLSLRPLLRLQLPDRVQDVALQFLLDLVGRQLGRVCDHVGVELEVLLAEGLVGVVDQLLQYLLVLAVEPQQHPEHALALALGLGEVLVPGCQDVGLELVVVGLEVVLHEGLELQVVPDDQVVLVEFLVLAGPEVVVLELGLEVSDDQREFLLDGPHLLGYFGQFVDLLDLLQFQGLNQVALEVLEMLISDDGVAVDLAELYGSVLQDCLDLVEVSVPDGLVEGNLFVLSFELVEVDLFLSDDDVDEVELLLLEDLEEVEYLVVKLREVEVVEAVLFFGEYFVEDLELFEDLLVKVAVEVLPRLHQHLQFFLQLLLVLVEDDDHCLVYCLHLSREVVLQVVCVLLVLLAVVGYLDELFQVLGLVQVLLQLLDRPVLLYAVEVVPEAIEGRPHAVVCSFILIGADLPVLLELRSQVVLEFLVLVNRPDEVELAKLVVVLVDLVAALQQYLPELLVQLWEEVELYAVVDVAVVEAADEVDLFDDALELLALLGVDVEDVPEVQVLHRRPEVLHLSCHVARDRRLLLGDDLAEEGVLRRGDHLLVLPHQQLRLLHLLRSGFGVGVVEGLELCDDVAVVALDLLVEVINLLLVVVQRLVVGRDVVAQLLVLRGQPGDFHALLGNRALVVAALGLELPLALLHLFAHALLLLVQLLDDGLVLAGLQLHQGLQPGLLLDEAPSLDLLLCLVSLGYLVLLGLQSRLQLLLLVLVPLLAGSPLELMPLGQLSPLSFQFILELLDLLVVVALQVLDFLLVFLLHLPLLLLVPLVVLPLLGLGIQQQGLFFVLEVGLHEVLLEFRHLEQFCLLALQFFVEVVPLPGYGCYLFAELPFPPLILLVGVLLVAGPEIADGLFVGGLQRLDLVGAFLLELVHLYRQILDLHVLLRLAVLLAELVSVPALGGLLGLAVGTWTASFLARAHTAEFVGVTRAFERKNIVLLLGFAAARAGSALALTL